MKSNSTRFQASALIALLAVMMACQKTPQPQQPIVGESKTQQLLELIVGKWQDVDGPVQFQFFADGTYTASREGKTEPGQYLFPDENHLKMIVRDGTYVFDITTLTPEKLVLKREGSGYTEKTLKRVH